MAHSRSCDLERCGDVRWADASYTFMYLHVDVYFLVYGT